VEQHFRDEEAVLELVRYPDLAPHRLAHQELLDTARLMRRDFQEGTLSYPTFLDYLANRVVKEHLFNADAAFRAWLPGGASVQRIPS